MKVFKNDYRGHGFESLGFSYHLTKTEAMHAAAQFSLSTKDNDVPMAIVETEIINIESV